MPKMIGIGLHHHHHHQMSYSPASGAAGSNADRKTNKSPAVRALRVRELSPDHEERELRAVAKSAAAAAECTGRNAVGKSRRQRATGQLVEMVRAETEMPAIVVDSLDQFDKCRRQRSRGAANQQQAERQTQPARNRVSNSNSNNNNLLITVAADAEQQARHLRRQARRQLETQRAATTSDGHQNQVVLIMSDSSALTTANTSGVPVLGRLLPSKSCGQQQQQQQERHRLRQRNLQVRESEPVLMRQVEPVFLAHPDDQHQQMAPVLGRRSHRLLRAVDSLLMEATSAAGPADEAQWLEQASSSGQSRVSRRSTATSSSSGSSLVQVRPVGGAELCRDACCVGGGPRRTVGRASPNVALRRGPAPMLNESQPAAAGLVCLMPCCHFEGSGRAGALDGRAPPSQNHTTCQANGFRLSSADLRPSRRSSSLCRLQEASFGQEPQPDPRQHHRLRQPPRVPSKPVSYQPGSKSSRSIEHKQLVRQCYASNEHVQSMQQLQQQQHEHESEGVTQMYESLAAELKAKLGNPNRAPILLPPKDYDTLCRQQGRLNGIETRRSTNPQLVGPKTKLTTSSPAGRQQQQHQPEMIAELDAPEIQRNPSYDDPASRLVHGGGGGGGGCLQRSRSNSSSGLGSISISAGSPDQTGRSSPSQRSSGSEPDVSTMLKAEHDGESGQDSPASSLQAKLVNDEFLMFGSPVARPAGVKSGAAAAVACADRPARNGRVEVPLKVNNDRRNGNTYLATKQIIY